MRQLKINLFIERSSLHKILSKMWQQGVQDLNVCCESEMNKFVCMYVSYGNPVTYSVLYVIKSKRLIDNARIMSKFVKFYWYSKKWNLWELFLVTLHRKKDLFFKQLGSGIISCQGKRKNMFSSSSPLYSFKPKFDILTMYM